MQSHECSLTTLNHKIRNVEPNIRLSRIRVICVLFLSAHCFRLPRTHSADVIQNGIYHITVCHVNWQVSLWLFDGFLCAHFMKQSTTIVKGNVSRRNIMSIINGRYTAQRHTREEPTKMRGKKWKSRWVHHNATNVDENQISFVEKRDNSLAIIILPTRRYADYAFVKPYTQSQPTQIYLNRHTHTRQRAHTLHIKTNLLKCQKRSAYTKLLVRGMWKYCYWSTKSSECRKKVDYLEKRNESGAPLWKIWTWK